MFNYYVEILFYPATQIGEIIDKLHNKNILQQCKTFDGQVFAVAEVLAEKKPVKRNSVTLEKPSVKKLDQVVDAFKTKRKIQFEIMVNPSGDTQPYDRRKQTIYTKDELQQDFETRTTIFYKKV